ncbi:hypothetical protein QBC37DRAFT_404338 [Rhypophila decipiens]|uniref:Myb-like domain-containing protein n=1 Tax=Rhypophila decipiens TaxID=261697 RepID=A0AAN7B489_9PEZI|nr:hypothetical protein QBC37DRAFT_404338 [Rhypophila decipiens]
MTGQDIEIIMVRIKFVEDYPEDGPLQGGRALARRLRAKKEKEEATGNGTPDPVPNAPVFSGGAEVAMRPSRPTRSGQAGVPPVAHKRVASAEVVVSPEKAAAKAKKHKESSTPDKTSSGTKPSTSKQQAASALPILRPQSSGRQGTSKGRGGSLPRSADRTNVTRGNGNQRGHAGTFLKATFYAEPNASLMRGQVWTEEDDFLLYYLKTKAQMTFTMLTRYLHPHSQGACQNRFQKMRAQFDALEGEEKVAAHREKERIGAKFEEGDFDYRIPLFEEAEARRVAAGNATSMRAKGASGKGAADAKGKGKVQGKQNEEDEDEEDGEEEE